MRDGIIEDRAGVSREFSVHCACSRKLRTLAVWVEDLSGTWRWVPPSKPKIGRADVVEMRPEGYERATIKCPRCLLNLQLRMNKMQVLLTRLADGGLNEMSLLWLISAAQRVHQGATRVDL